MLGGLPSDGGLPSGWRCLPSGVSAFVGLPSEGGLPSGGGGQPSEVRSACTRHCWKADPCEKTDACENITSRNFVCRR